MAADVNGILLLDKPLGLSSAGAVARAKHLFNARKAGHTGSLDPLASGMLPICFGEATKFGALMLDADKTYRVVARLGERTASADLESPVIETRELPPWSQETVAAVLRDFPRCYSQIPPMHSALKQDGRPLYEYARAGITRDRVARQILIHDMRLLDWRPPDIHFDVRCSKGAYIRVLAEDIAARLGTFAHLVGLRRIGVAPFEVQSPWTFEALEAMDLPRRQNLLLPVDAALGTWRSVDLPPKGVDAFRQGRAVDLPGCLPGTVRIYGMRRDDAEPAEGGNPATDAAGESGGRRAAERIFLGLGEVGPAGRLIPKRLISAAMNRA